MSDLAEFLLARIAEDERIAAAWKDDTETWSNPYESGVAIAFQDRFGLSRVLADCEAKRRIVEADPRYGNPWNGCGDDCEVKAHEWVLRALAAPYADHPDYRQEWQSDTPS